MKVKELEIAGNQYTIGSLTVDQYEGLIGDGVTVQGKEFIRQHMIPIVAASLLNAQSGNGRWFPNWPQDGITPQSTSANLDLDELNALYKEVIELSGLKSKQPGEAVAAASQ